MMGEDQESLKEQIPREINENINRDNKKKKKKKRGGSKRKMTAEQSVAYKYVKEWVYLEKHQESVEESDDDDDFASGLIGYNQPKERLVFDLHSHSTHSDGYLTPSKLLERAHQNGVKVLALTDHDTLSGIPEALDVAQRYGIKIIPGVEISTAFFPRGASGPEEPVHILAYYSSCGPMRYEKLDKCLSNIRDGRFLRAKEMISKLNKLKLPLKWEQVAKVAGKGVAPGRLHVARAMVEAGHVENLKQAFARYLYDGGPAYSTGSEPIAEEAVQLIRETGGVAVLAHPWALKDPVAVVRRLKEAGLHGIETYRSDGKLEVYSDLADKFGLLKLGGSDYHARGGQHESDLGSVSLPMVTVRAFLAVARPIWRNAIRDLVENCLEDPSEVNLQIIMKFSNTKMPKCLPPFDCGTQDLIQHVLSTKLTNEERKSVEFDTIRSKLSQVLVNQVG
ncbi:hypothetical protein Leryth_025701 [Lithospermum erythrorhizon]|nr:hypothetical protein Leryth_025701 [Lithospermum erythrorhizon]